MRRCMFVPRVDDLLISAVQFSEVAARIRTRDPQASAAGVGPAHFFWSNPEGSRQGLFILQEGNFDE